MINRFQTLLSTSTCAPPQWHPPLLETFRTLFMRCIDEPHLHVFFRELYNKLRPVDKKGWWALRLLTATSSGDPPTPEEVVDMGEYLGGAVQLDPGFSQLTPRLLSTLEIKM